MFHPPRASNSRIKVEEARGGGVEVGGQLGDFISQAIQLRSVMSSERMDLHGEASFC